MVHTQVKQMVIGLLDILHYIRTKIMVKLYTIVSLEQIIGLAMIPFLVMII